MEISEAAKRAAKAVSEMAYTVRIEEPTSITMGRSIVTSQFKIVAVEQTIQRAIDAETAELRKELMATRHTYDWTVAERDRERDRNRALVEALRDAKMYFKGKGEDGHNVVAPNLRMASELLRKHLPTEYQRTWGDLLNRYANEIEEAQNKVDAALKAAGEEA